MVLKSKDYLIFVVKLIKNKIMYKIEYQIGLNDKGRPYVGLPENYDNKPEDRFFAIEVTRYLLQDLMKRRSQDLDLQTISAMDEAERLLGQIGDEMAAILYKQMKASGDASMYLGNSYDIVVNGIEERDALPIEGILYDDKIFDRVEGLIVLVHTPVDEIIETTKYELIGGITNEHWKEI